MARIRIQDEYEGRREAFLDATWALILKEGYEALSVNRLIAHAQSSKGAFYHYFSSKDEVVDATVEHVISGTLSDIEHVYTDEAGAVEQLEGFLGVSTKRPAATADLRRLLVQVHRSGNQALVAVLLDRAMSLCLPALERIIERGIEEGVFDTPFPTEAAELILAAGEQALLSSIRSLNETRNHQDVINLLLRRSEATIFATERLLGLKRGTLERQTRSRAKQTVAAAKRL